MSGDEKSTVVDRPPSSQPDDARETPTALERPPSTPHAIGTRDPSGKRPRRSSHRSSPPGARYESGEEIGRGGMGRVVEATDTLLDRRVAVKAALTTDAELLRRFARETKITAKLEHPSIVPVYDAGVVDGSPFYVMRRVTGRPLSELIRAAPTLEKRLALVPHVLAAAQAIAHAHQRGIIHRDIKPSNILVGDLGETVVIDWGLAKVIGETDDRDSDAKEPDASSSLRTRIGMVIGTPGFMDPNQLRGDAVGSQGDVYSLGASLYNLLAGEPPHYTDDSTRMMKLAAQGPPTPISQVVRGVPAELSTIVDTATDYDITKRYQDAGAFAEELQRFLAGQLVASHRYSRTERFVRFIRQHRAAVAIGSAATVLVIVIGAFAISQVLEERDRADEQARLATQGRHEAEAARAMADERADQLLISRANALVETNPTAAVASLKQLSPKSKRIHEARAIASAARLRGVAWAMKASDQTQSFVTLDQTASRVAQLTTDGKLHVYDLDARRLAFEVQLERGTKIRWIREGKQLLAGGLGPTRLFTPAGVEIQSDLPELLEVETDERGVVLVMTDVTRRAFLVNLEKQTRIPLAERATAITIAREGTRCTVTTENDFVVYDQAGTPILHRPNAGKVKVVHSAVSETKVAVIEGMRVMQAPLVQNGTWSEIKPEIDAGTYPYWLEYTGGRLLASYINSHILIEFGGKLRELGRMDGVRSVGMSAFGEDYLVVGSDGQRIYYVDGRSMRSLYLPITLRFVRLVARKAHARVVAVGDGAIVVMDLDALPKLLPIERHQATMFINERTLLSTDSYLFGYVWYDLIDKRSTQTTAQRGSARIRAFDHERSRMLVIQMRQDGSRAFVFQAGDLTPRDSIEVPFDDVQFAGRGLIYSRGNRIFGGFSPASRPELFTTEGTPQILISLDASRYAVIAEHEIVRGDLETGAIERMRLSDGPPVTYATPHGKDVVFARKDRIFRWSATVTEVAKLEGDVDFVLTLEHGVLARLANHSTVFIAADGTVTRVSSATGGVVVSDDRVIVPGQLHYDVIEVPSLARWSLPLTRTAEMTETQLDLSPSGTQVVERSDDGRFWLWKLPVTDDFATALEATNLVEDQNGLLLWPWQ